MGGRTRLPADGKRLIGLPPGGAAVTISLLQGISSSQVSSQSWDLADNHSLARSQMLKSSGFFLWRKQGLLDTSPSQSLKWAVGLAKMRGCALF